ncbi:ATP-binding cassette domain-containing protein, partial [Candidatus Aerophobetes bacterium]|nr:ATP-binding cassette domain-containing protein [Candidatus Aerophobetes bacterium]
VYENLSYPLRIRKMPPSEIDKRVRYIAEILQITDLLDRKPRQLSGGQQQRVGVGRAIVRNPQVFLMDEPISHLDAKLRTLMRAELKRLQRELNTTTIYVTHDQQEAISMADRIGVMNLGVLQQVGTPDEIFNRPANIFVAGFIGDPPMNFFECRARRKQGEMFLQGSGFEIKVPLSLSSKVDAIASDALVIGIRPPDFIPRTKPLAGNNLVKGEVVVTEPLGEEEIVNVKIGDVIAKVQTSIDFQVDRGQIIWLEVNYEGLHIFDKDTGKAIT